MLLRLLSGEAARERHGVLALKLDEVRLARVGPLRTDQEELLRIPERVVKLHAFHHDEILPEARGVGALGKRRKIADQGVSNPEVREVNLLTIDGRTAQSLRIGRNDLDDVDELQELRVASDGFEAEARLAAQFPVVDLGTDPPSEEIEEGLEAFSVANHQKVVEIPEHPVVDVVDEEVGGVLEIFDDGRKRSVDEKVRKIRFDEILRAVARKFGGREGPQLLLDNELFSRSPNPLGKRKRRGSGDEDARRLFERFIDLLC